MLKQNKWRKKKVWDASKVQDETVFLGKPANPVLGIQGFYKFFFQSFSSFLHPHFDFYVNSLKNN